MIDFDCCKRYSKKMILNKKSLQRYVKYSLMLLTLVMVAVVFYREQEIFIRLRLIRPKYLVALFFANLLHAVTQSLNFRALIDAQGRTLNQIESFELTMAGRFYNFILPLKAGNVLRSVYLKKIHDFAYRSFLFFMFYQFISFLIIIPLCLSVIFILIDGITVEQRCMYAFLSIGLSITAFLLSKGPTFVKKFLKIKKASFVIEKVPSISTKHWLNVAIGVLLFWFASALKMYVAFKSIDLDFSFLRCCIVSGTVIVITQIGITPGDMGAKEFIIGFAAKLLKLSMAQGLLGAFIDRAAEMFITIPFGIYYSTKILREKSIDIKKHIKEIKL